MVGLELTSALSLIVETVVRTRGYNGPGSADAFRLAFLPACAVGWGPTEVRQASRGSVGAVLPPGSWEATENCPFLFYPSAS